jgi:hypothetical protein
MKKISYLANVLLLGIMAVSFIKSKEGISEKLKKDFFCDSTKICMDYSNPNLPPFNYLNGNLLREMSANYDTTPINMNLTRLGYSPIVNLGTSNHVIKKPGNPLAQDSRSIWFSLDSLKRFIWEIESAICKNKCSIAKNLGIRLYYARYPMINNNNPNHRQLLLLNTTYQKLHTIFMIPTYESISNNQVINIDFDPRLFDSKRCTYKSIIEPPNGWRFLAFSPIPITNQLAQNHGDLCPPVCGGTAF